MRARDFFIVANTINSTAGSSVVPISTNTGLSSIVSSFQMATSNKTSEPFGDINIFVDSLTISGGTVTGNFGKSSTTSESTDSIDTILIATKG